MNPSASRITNAAAIALEIRQQCVHIRFGSLDIALKERRQKRSGGQNCITIGHRVPGTHTSELASSKMVGATTQTPTRNANPRERAVGRDRPRGPNAQKRK